MRDPLELLRGTIHILLIDDDPDARSLLAEGIHLCPLMKVHTAGSNTEAFSILETCGKCHTIITDLGICDREGDEFAVIRKYARLVPTFCITGRQEPKTAFEASQLGARELFIKPVCVTCGNFVNTLESAFFWCLGNRVIVAEKNDLIEKAVALLTGRNYSSVSMWANELGVSEGYFRDAWSATCSIRLKHVLYLKNLYHQAFAYCRSMHAVAETGRGDGQVSLVDTHRYFYSNKDAIQRVIQRIAAIRPRHFNLADGSAKPAGYAVKHSKDPWN